MLRVVCTEKKSNVSFGAEVNANPVIYLACSDSLRGASAEDRAVVAEKVGHGVAEY